MLTKIGSEQVDELVDQLVANQQKTIEHLLDQNAQLLNLIVSMSIPQVAPNTEPSVVEPDIALAGGSND